MTFIHIHVIERGIGVLHMPIQGRLYSMDKWDTKNNAKLEEKWNKQRGKNPNFKVPYHKLSTFKGYVFFDDLTPRQREEYERIKVEKRKNAFEKYIRKPEELTFYDKILKLILDKKITQDGLRQMCMVENRDYKHTRERLNRMIKKVTEDDSRGINDYFYVSEKEAKKINEERNKEEVLSLIGE